MVSQHILERRSKRRAEQLPLCATTLGENLTFLQKEKIMQTVGGRRKITVGFVIQIFSDDGKYTEQEFKAIDGSQISYEDAEGNSIEPWPEFQTFNMVQPGTILVHSNDLQALIDYAACEIDTRIACLKDAGPDRTELEAEITKGNELLARMTHFFLDKS